MREFFRHKQGYDHYFCFKFELTLIEVEVYDVEVYEAKTIIDLILLGEISSADRIKALKSKTSDSIPQNMGRVLTHRKNPPSTQ